LKHVRKTLFREIKTGALDVTKVNKENGDQYLGRVFKQSIVYVNGSVWKAKKLIETGHFCRCSKNSVLYSRAIPEPLPYKTFALSSGALVTNFN
jgi:hypothetical protein